MMVMGDCRDVQHSVVLISLYGSWTTCSVCVTWYVDMQAVHAVKLPLRRNEQTTTKRIHLTIM